MVEMLSKMDLQFLMKLNVSLTWALPFYLFLGFFRCLPSMAQGTLKKKVEILALMLKVSSRWTVLYPVHYHCIPLQNGQVDEGRTGIYGELLWTPFTDSLGFCFVF